MSFKNCLIVVPMKNLNRSKSRLEKYVTKEIKNKIVLKLFSNTLKKINKVTNFIDGDFNLAVLTSCDQIKEFVRKKNISIIKDKYDHSLSNSIQFAADWAVKKNYLSICIFPADIACLNEEDVKRMQEEAKLHEEEDQKRKALKKRSSLKRRTTERNLT